MYHTQTFTQWTTDFDVRDKTIKLLIENTEIRLCNLGTDKPLLEIWTKSTSDKKGKKKKNRDLSKIRNFYDVNNTIKKVKR